MFYFRLQKRQFLTSNFGFIIQLSLVHWWWWCSTNVRRLYSVDWQVTNITHANIALLKFSFHILLNYFSSVVLRQINCIPFGFLEVQSCCIQVPVCRYWCLWGSLYRMWSRKIVYFEPHSLLSIVTCIKRCHPVPLQMVSAIQQSSKA